MGECNGRVQWESAMGECNGRVQWESAMGECHGRVQWESAMGECNGRVPWESAMGECNGRVQWESAMGECPRRTLCMLLLSFAFLMRSRIPVSQRCFVLRCSALFIRPSVGTGQIGAYIKL